MTLLVFAIAVILCVGLLVYGVQRIPALAEPFKSIAIVLLCLVGVVLIAQKAGVF